MQEFQYSDAGVALTKQFEGLRLEAYQDAGGVWTVGYGHTGPDVHMGLRVTEPEADMLLRKDVEASVECVNCSLTRAVAQEQFDALVDFCFNVGGSRFKSSTLLRLVNSGDFVGAAEQFGLWDKVAGKPLGGLVRRRAAEAALFLSVGVDSKGA